MTEPARRIQVRRDGDTLSLTLDHPPVNVITIAMLRELAAAVRTAGDARAIRIGAAGENFSAGVDVGEHLEPRAADMLSAFRELATALWRFEGIVMAAVDGVALGGACELVCLCDIVLATDRAEFGQPETAVGVFPPVAAVLWPRAMGYARALERIVLGERLSAAEMRDAGFVTRVCAPDELQRESDDTLARVRSTSRAVTAHAKRAVRIGAGVEDIDAALARVENLYLNSLMKTKDATEGLRAFLEKRRPEWADQ